jgi:hypothetical protein
MQHTLLAAVAALSIGAFPPRIVNVAVQRPLASGANTTSQAPSTSTDAHPEHRAWLFPPVANYLNQRPG